MPGPVWRRSRDGSRRSVGEPVAEHRKAAERLGLGRLVLEHVPVLGQPAVLDADDVGSDPGGGSAISREAAVCDHVVALGDDQLVLVFQRDGQRADQVEQSIAAGRNVGAVLEVAFRPEPLGGVVVPLVPVPCWYSC